VPVLGVAGFSDEPAVSIANAVVQEILAAPYDWKWNRNQAPSFVTNTYQQDYSTSITNLGWIENASRVRIKTTQQPPQIEVIESVRDILPTSDQGDPWRMSWTPNALAACGAWTANLSYADPAAAATTPLNPLLQIRDRNGNVQVVTGFGVTGATEPDWSTAAGAQTVDGTVTWTCVDPLGIAWRLNKLPGWNAIAWRITPVYQAKPPLISRLSSTWDPIPDELAFVFRQGFLAHCLRHAEDQGGAQETALFMAMLQRALGQSDREIEDFGLIPGGLM
jgi:hypothetical protein